ncbi:MAG: M28 family peptidase [Candidatus Zixiibacteriota bacterium]|nr:MAG: M28 family peptidase [candidate division Zixibacteria bacterium]
MRNLILFVAVATVMASAAVADNLYQVNLHSHRDAEILKNLETDVLRAVSGGYLVLADRAKSQALEESGLDIVLLGTNLNRGQLAWCKEVDKGKLQKFDVLFEQGLFHLLRGAAESPVFKTAGLRLFPLPERKVEVRFRPPPPEMVPDLTASYSEDIEQIIALVDQASLESFVLRLEAFYRRFTCTDPCHLTRDWIESKFVEFGCDQIEIDPFESYQWVSEPEPCTGYNVIGKKLGTVYPDQQIVIGGHFDGVPDCPAADDNATGTALVLEIARVLQNIDTDRTFVFVAFDSEESGLVGSYHYADEAVARGDDIVLMINADMIAHETNDTRADLYCDWEYCYGQLWDQLSNTHVGINGDLIGWSLSDDEPFGNVGYDALGVQEKIFSPHWHQLTDSSVYLNFDYMTRMVKATLATAYTVSQSPRAMTIAEIRQGGDGQSLQPNWHPHECPNIVEYQVGYYPTAAPWNLNLVSVPVSDTCVLVTGLIENVEYGFFVQAQDANAMWSVPFYRRQYALPLSKPLPPCRFMALPIRDAVWVTWAYDNRELDFDHCAVIRDGEVVAQTLDTMFIDSDPVLYTGVHYYYVTSVDTDGNHSDTVGVGAQWAKAAALEPARVLAVNRTGNYIIDFASANQTGLFLQEALQPYDYDYYCDTLATKYPHDLPQLDLVDMVDYGLMVVGAEAGKYDDIGVSPATKNGILDTLAYYMSIGGKVIVFGRWGDLYERDTVDYTANAWDYDDVYRNWFHIDYRVQTETDWPFLSTVVTSDLVGAHSKDHNYPRLYWDSLLTLEHANSQNGTVTDVSGIPCATFVSLSSELPEVIYTYDCRKKTKSMRTEGQPVAWKYLGTDYCYMYFDIPLSMFERDPAIAALRLAIDELMAGPAPQEQLAKPSALPADFALRQNYPNPFNPGTEIVYSLPKSAHVTLAVYNILGQKVATLVDARRDAGTHHVFWYGTDEGGQAVATGIYLYRLEAGNFKESKKMLLLR